MAILGIDLGTTNSACGIWQEDGAKLIPNRLGEILTPSVVGLDDNGEIIVGDTAKQRLITHSDKTVAVFKRLMGADHKVKLGKKTFSAVELSSLVLRSIKEDAEAFLGEPVEEAVISVPAYFNDNQRHATKIAGELAGLKVDRLINEPTAAAMAYGINDNKESTVIVLDMGGGTFDVSILEFFDNIMEVHATTGDNFLGGEDFVETMVDNVLSELGVEKAQLSAKESQRLYQQMEIAKRQVSQKPEQELLLNLAGQSHDWTFTAAWFEKVTKMLLLRIQRPIESAMRDAQLHPSEIDDVILVGGATRMAVFRQTVGRMFNRIPASHIDPDTVVAMGAAIQAGLKSKDSALDDVVLTDVSSYTLGTEVTNDAGTEAGYFLPIIERNMAVPVSIVRTLHTVGDDQTGINVKIYQGENRRVEKNIYLGALGVKVPKNKAGEESVDVRYSYDMNGLLEVEVTVNSTGQVYRKLIERAPGVLDESQKAESLKKLAALKFHPRDQEENRLLIAKGERLFESSLGDTRNYIGNVMAEFDKVLAGQRQAEIVKYRTKLAEILDSLEEGEW